MNYTVSYRPQPAAGAAGYVFVVGHMRSYSSLLAHILGSNPQLCGYAEMHQSYLGRNDLRRLERGVEAVTGTPVAGRLALDKILHNHHEIADSVLRRPDVRVVFLLREPAATLASIARIADELDSRGWKDDPHMVLDYYQGRLVQLATYSRCIEHGAAFIAAERLIEATDVVLGRLTDWLQLAQPLAPEYRTFRLTGKAGYGDPSPAIQSGRVDPKLVDAPADAGAPRLPDAMIEQARAAWSACREALTARCVAL